MGTRRVDLSGWYFSRFDYLTFLDLREKLQHGAAPELLRELASNAESREIVQAVTEDGLPIAEACTGFVQAVCCVGDTLYLDRGLARFTALLARQPGAEEAADLLAALALGRKNVEPWFATPTGTMGFLNPEEAAILGQALFPLVRQGALRVGFGGYDRQHPRQPGMRVALSSILRHLFHVRPREDEMLRMLGDLLREANRRGEGIAAIAAV